ncbi:hypothetical protein [Lutibacter sp.]|uniref:hypothetical protein n=1 Tax=Lutibacter sp. TaxID=1925666 RepID=UPI003565B06D
MKKITLLLFLLFTIVSFSQNSADYVFGEISYDELNLKKYDLDTTANAIFLLDIGSTEFLTKLDEIAREKQRVVSTKFYKKIKFFNSEEFENQGTIKIRLYNNTLEKDAVIDIKAVTHNNFEKTYLDEENIYEERLNDNWREVKFTMPNLKEGSIVEVEYTIESPFTFRLPSWIFQTDIPVKFSQYTASIPGNYVFNRKLNGILKLKTNSSVIKNNCFIISHFERAASCEVITYAMENIPAFKEEKEFMTSRHNFISKIKFELAEYQRINGTKVNHTTTWEAVDKNFKTDKDIGGQLKQTKLLHEIVPIEINSLPTDLEKATAIFSFIQSYFTWNEKYGVFSEINIKNALENKTGNVGEINISLINALKSAGLKAELVLISTRENGFPTKLHPVRSDFNYMLARVTINNKSYLLDATNKLTPFGLLPYKCLNGYGRVMDFENSSYWIDIIPENNSKNQISVSLKLHEDGTFHGKLRKVNFGYEALLRRTTIQNKSDEAIISEFENNFNNLDVIDYKIENKLDINQPLIETFEISIDNSTNTSGNYFNPFFAEQFKENPFIQENRLYPVDFGYTRKYILNFSLEIPESYSIESFPDEKSIALPENGGNFSLSLNKNSNTKITLNSSIKINKPVFYNSEYQLLKELFKQIISSQKTPIVLKKN